MSSLTLDSLAEAPRWVAWRNENLPRGITKVPYSAPGRKALANKPTTWRTRAQAEKIAQQVVNGIGGGIGLVLGELPDGSYIAGIDLDTCRTADGKLEPWAMEVIERFATYTETSPSGTGVKTFFIIAAENVAPLIAAMGSEHGRQWKAGKGEHPPAIELHISNRYFALTDQHLAETPLELVPVPFDQLLWLVQQAGPALAVRPKRGETGNQRAGADHSRSGVAFRKGAALKRAGATFAQMVEALLADPETAEWTRTKGEANNQRELLRIWEKPDTTTQLGKRQDFQPHLGWLAEVQVDGNGEPRPNLYNVMLPLRDDPRISDLFAFDEMEQATIVSKPVPSRVLQANGPDSEPRQITDADVSTLQELLQASGLERIGKDLVHQAVDLRARERAFHPVRNYLNGLEWDGTPRLASWIVTYLGAADAEYHRSIACMFIVSMVARIFQPGCQCDYMPIFEGEQGKRKSTALQVLAGQWFSDALPDMHSDGVRVSQHLRGKWLIEIAEMAAMSKADAATLKAFVSRREEKFTPKYGRKEVTEPRQCVFAGTTNEAIYLRDQTGGRRFWPVKTSTINLAELGRDRDQLFAEAVELYRRGYQWWPDSDFERKFIKPEQEERYEDDVWTDAVQSYLDVNSRVTLLEIAQHGLRIDLPKIGTIDQRRIASILHRLGWRQPRRRGRGPNGERYYYPAHRAEELEAETTISPDALCQPAPPYPSLSCFLPPAAVAPARARPAARLDGPKIPHLGVALRLAWQAVEMVGIYRCLIRVRQDIDRTTCRKLCCWTMSQPAASPSKTTRLVNPEYRPVILGKLDRRSWQGRLLRDTRAELAAHVGKPSAVQSALIEQLAQLRLRLALYDRRFAERGEQTDHDRRSYLAFANTYARLLGRLGLAAAADRPPTLAERIARESAAPPSPLAWAVPPPGPVRRPEPTEGAP